MSRAAVRSDADAVFRLFEQFPMSYAPRRDTFDRHFPVLVDDPTAILLVAEQDGEVLGYALAFQMLTLYANGPIVELQELMIDPNHQARGVGRELVEDLLARARAMGCAEATVPTRRAPGFYEKLGFIQTGVYLKYRLLA
jgi:N-acetylglutamate synthase-like GNAT family acetyltransferase